MVFDMRIAFNNGFTIVCKPSQVKSDKEAYEEPG